MGGAYYVNDAARLEVNEVVSTSDALSPFFLDTHSVIVRDQSYSRPRQTAV